MTRPGASLWGVDFVTERNAVDRHVRTRRAELQNDRREPRSVATVPRHDRAATGRRTGSQGKGAVSAVTTTVYTHRNQKGVTSSLLGKEVVLQNGRPRLASQRA